MNQNIKYYTILVLHNRFILGDKYRELFFSTINRFFCNLTKLAYSKIIYTEYVYEVDIVFDEKLIQYWNEFKDNFNNMSYETKLNDEEKAIFSAFKLLSKTIQSYCKVPTQNLKVNIIGHDEYIKRMSKLFLRLQASIIFYVPMTRKSWQELIRGLTANDYSVVYIFNPDFKGKSYRKIRNIFDLDRLDEVNAET
jgi:hypothetical protein